MASGGTANPASWNRYAYVEGDPVNLRDPRWLQSEGPSQELVWCPALDIMTTEAHCALASNPGPLGPVYSAPTTDFNVDVSSFAGKSYSSGNLKIDDVRMGLGLKSFIERVGGKVLNDEKCRNWLMPPVFAPSRLLLSSLLTNVSRETAVAQVTTIDGSVAPTALINKGHIHENGVSVIIDSDGQFFSTSAAGKAFIMLHEIAHLAQVHKFIQGDGDGTAGEIAAKQAANNAAVTSNCGKVISSFSSTHQW